MTGHVSKETRLFLKFQAKPRNFSTTKLHPIEWNDSHSSRINSIRSLSSWSKSPTTGSRKSDTNPLLYHSYNKHGFFSNVSILTTVNIQGGGVSSRRRVSSSKSVSPLLATSTITTAAESSVTTSPELTSESRTENLPLEETGKRPITSENTVRKIPFEVQYLDHSSPRKSTSASNVSVYAPYLALTKPRLSALVVLSAMSAYALTPYDATLSQLLFLTIGTAMTSGSANAINMGREYQYDGLMTRTKTRPVVRGLLSPQQAFQFAGVSGVMGVAALYFGVNPTVAALGAGNIILYGWIYTSLKRKSILNTWVGAVVGAIPPLMGWAASSSLADPGAWALAGLLYAWQFPHFNSLSHNIREEYRRAGYIMTAWTNPALNARVAFRYSVAMFPLCLVLCYCNVTDWFYAVDSGILNGWLTYLAFKFWTEQRSIVGPVIEAASSSSSGGSSSYARKLFWGSVLHLPGILVLAMIHKKGQWDWLWNGRGLDEEDDAKE